MSQHSDKSSRDNAFRRFWALGYRSLLPVIPPTAGVRNAGKRPGVFDAGTGWSGRAADSFQASLETLDAWHRMGASVGLSCNGSQVTGLDIDVLTPEWADRVREIACEMLGVTARRIGQAPKTMLVYRCAKDTRYRRLLFNDGRRVEPGVAALRPAIVELLAGPGKWFVVAGDHPVTGKPYFWPEGVPSYDMLPFVSAAEIDAFFRRLGEELPRASRLSSSLSMDRAKIDQASLIGDEKLIADAMRALPNDPGAIDYDHWVAVAIALRGALPDNYQLGLELFEDWTDRADFPKPSEDAERVYGSVEPPHTLGANYIFDLAQAAGWQGHRPLPNPAWFDDKPVIEEPAPYQSIFGDSDAIAAERFAMVHIDDVVERALDHVPRPLVKGLLEEQTMSVVYGDSNVGKTFVAMDMAYHVATGRNYAGMAVTQGGVVYVTTEGGRGVDDRLLALRTRFEDAAGSVSFYLLSTDIDLHAEKGDTGPLIAAIAALGVSVSLVVVDVLAQAMGQGEENAGRDMIAMVRNGNKIIRATRSHLMWIHHTGKDAAKGARGHSSLRAGTDTELEVADGKITATKQRNLNREWDRSFKLVPFIAGERRKVAGFIDTCVVELLPKGSAEDEMTSALREMTEALRALGALSDERAVLASDVSAWFEDGGKKLKPHTVRMRLNRLVDSGVVAFVKFGGHRRYRVNL